jgi:hypothetical protein
MPDLATQRQRNWFQNPSRAPQCAIGAKTGVESNNDTAHGAEEGGKVEKTRQEIAKGIPGGIHVLGYSERRWECQGDEPWQGCSVIHCAC